VAATSALIWPARYAGFIDAIMRETWNAAQSSSSRANGILAYGDSIIASLRPTGRGLRQIGIHFVLHVVALVDRLDAEVGDEADHEQPGHDVHGGVVGLRLRHA